MRISFAIGAMLLVACSGSSLGDRDDGGSGFDSALPPGVDAGPGVDAFVPPGVDAGPDAAPAPLACDERFTAPASAAA
ncbi:MAG TPA: hypothetical protein RMG45_28035, partial [Polyangiaceae bacterium LLY-WYZ-15_(1-7)]|nr:hypothetical protein [Polyangiaceae bacterium LLY-WYZ-15_(1-7)]